MDRERVIVYIDESTDDGMIWEELNQEGQMQVSVYDEELGYDVEYNHSVVVKSLQEYLADHDKQVRKEVVQEIKNKAYQDCEFYESENGGISIRQTYLINEHILEQIQGGKR